MNVIDTIIEQRSKIMEISAAHRVTALKLYGSVLARREKRESEIDFLAVFDPRIPYEWNATFEFCISTSWTSYSGTTIMILKPLGLPIRYICRPDQLVVQPFIKITGYDLKICEEFDFTEVLYICDKIYDELFDQSPEEIQRFKELLPKIKEYVVTRLLQYEK